MKSDVCIIKYHDNDNDNVDCINQSKTEVQLHVIIKCSQLHSLSILWELLCNYLYYIAEPKQMYCIYVTLTVAWLRRGSREAGELISRDPHFQHNKDNYGKQSQYSSKQYNIFLFGQCAIYRECNNKCKWASVMTNIEGMIMINYYCIIADWEYIACSAF